MTTVTIPVLETDRLILRAPTVADFEPFAACFASERARFIGGPVTDRYKCVRRFGHFSGHWLLRGYGSFVLERKADGVAVGQAGAWHPITWPERELGWALWDGAHEGQGYVTEAMMRVRDWVFGDLGWDTAVSYIRHGNDPSVAVAKRLGARPDPNAATPHGDPCHVYRHSPHAVR